MNLPGLAAAVLTAAVVPVVFVIGLKGGGRLPLLFSGFLASLLLVQLGIPGIAPDAAAPYFSFSGGLSYIFIAPFFITHW